MMNFVLTFLCLSLSVITNTNGLQCFQTDLTQDATSLKNWRQPADQLVDCAAAMNKLAGMQGNLGGQILPQMEYSCFKTVLSSNDKSVAAKGCTLAGGCQLMEGVIKSLMEQDSKVPITGVKCYECSGRDACNSQRRNIASVGFLGLALLVYVIL